LSFAKSIALSHQEKWDGSGYPKGLAGDAIPIPARLMAVADVYDALISRRVYKDGMAHEQAVHIMLEGRGSHFDADMIDAFIDIQQEFIAIAQRFADTDSDMDKKKDYLLGANLGERIVSDNTSIVPLLPLNSHRQGVGFSMRPDMLCLFICNKSSQKTRPPVRFL